jgi:hypothetical protein
VFIGYVNSYGNEEVYSSFKQDYYNIIFKLQVLEFCLLSIL